MTRRDQLYRAWKPCRDQLVDLKILKSLVSLARPYFSSTIRPGVLQESMRHLVGSRPSGAVLFQEAWRLSGNVPQLRKLSPVRPWMRQGMPEWVPVQITSVSLKLVGLRKKLGHEIVFRILAGTSAGLIVKQWWSKEKSRHVATRKQDNGPGFGFTRIRSDGLSLHPYLDPKQLVTLRCLALIVAEQCVDGPGFDEISFTPSLSDWNQEQQKYRARLDDEHACPEGFERDKVPCHLCPVGLDRCRVAVHNATYEYRHCPNCQQEAPFDPDRPKQTVCVRCAEQSLFKE